MKITFFKRLLTAAFLGGLTSVSQAAIFSDNFDDPDFTSSHWQDGNDKVQQTWDFVLLDGSDLGYRATIDAPPMSTEEPAVKIANNAGEYCVAGLYIETLVRIGFHVDAYNTENKVSVGFYASDEPAYVANFRLNYEEATPIIDLYLNVYGNGQSEPVLDVSPISIDYDIFYKLVVQVDSNEAIDVFLYDLDDTLLGNVSSPIDLTADKGVVAIAGRYVTTFNNFYLSEADTDNDGVADCNDDCPCIFNPDQIDMDDNGIGDECNARYYQNDLDQDCDVDGDDLYSYADTGGSDLYNFSTEYGVIGSP